jgi:mRNA interferase YafQ
MRTPKFTSTFKRDFKSAEKRGKDLEKFTVLLDVLLEGLPVPAEYKNHPLK